jgi:hypothetical protein
MLLQSFIENLISQEKMLEVLNTYLSKKTSDRKIYQSGNCVLLNNAFLTYGFYKKKLDLEFIQRV